MPTRVLLVEDDPTIRLILSRRLKASGYEVFVGENGGHALRVMEKEHIPLIVSDWMMPEMDGIELCRRIKADRDLYPNYFIMMTAKGDKEDCIKGLDAGADDFLSKPIDEGELLARLKAGERVVAQQRNLKDLACTDSLTCLRNRRSFEDDLDKRLAGVKHGGHPFSLILIDLDNFKEINDRWGHATGDHCLRLFGQFLILNVRRNDNAYRIGGDEFAVILPEIEEKQAKRAALRLEEAFALHREERRGEFPCRLTFSAGTATAHPGAEATREQLIQSADRIMYQNKKRLVGKPEDKRVAPAPEMGTVLVVDDEPVMRKVLQKKLSEAGYRIRLAENGETCLDLLRREKPDVLILDWILPNMDGMEVCQRIHEDTHISPPYVIMLTVVRGTKSRIHALDSGADDYISKPVDIDELLARVRVGVRMERMKRQIARAEKLEGVMQMAGAVAHELSQPLTSLMGLADLVLMRMDESDPNHEYVRRIAEQAKRLGELTKKVGRIMKYEARDYLGGTKIVDIERASQTEDPT